MFENGLFTNILGAAAEISIWSFFACMFTSLVLGAALTNVMMHRSNCSKSFAVTVALFPLIVCTIVLLVSDNFGAGLAIAGAFSLIKFRSAAGAAKEISALFIAVAMGIACGTGYIGIAVFFSLVVLVLFFVYSSVGIWETHKDDDMYCLTVSYSYFGPEEDIEPEVREIIDLYAKKCEKKKVSVKQKKRDSEAHIMYSLELDSEPEELLAALRESELKMHYSLEKDEKAGVKRL